MKTFKTALLVSKRDSSKTTVVTILSKSATQAIILDWDSIVLCDIVSNIDNVITLKKKDELLDMSEILEY